MTNLQSSEIESKGSISCPKCGTAMRAAMAGAVEIERCDNCGGLWLDSLENEQLAQDKHSAASVDTRQAPNAALNNKVRIKCPHDHSQLIHMVDIKQPHIGFESCNICGGVFLDAGELKDLSERTLSERLGLR